MTSLFETVFYIVVSGFQVYTIRKWFSGNSILGYEITPRKMKFIVQRKLIYLWVEKDRRWQTENINNAFRNISSFL